MPPSSSASAVRHPSLEAASVWALIATALVAAFIVIPVAAVPFLPTKSFVLAAGAILTLALYILARLSRGNIIAPPFALIGALWLPVLAYALSTAFSGVSFASAFWGTTLESDTLGFMLTVAVLGTVAALVLRRTEHYRLALTAGGWIFGALAALQVLILVVGQFAPSAVPPAFSFVGSASDLASVLGLGVVAVLLTLRFLDLGIRPRAALLVSGGIALLLLAVLNSELVWILVALVALGLFVEAVMKRRPAALDAEFGDMAEVHEPREEDGHIGALLVPLFTLAVSLFFLIGANLGNALSTALHVNVLSVSPSWQSTMSVARKTYASAPFFGSGPGTFGVQWLKYRDASLNTTAFWNFDFSSGIGFIPTSFVSTGLFGVAAWVGLLGLFVFFGLRMLILRAPEDAFARYSAILSFVAALFLFVVAIFGLPGPVVLALAFLFAGFFASTMRYGGSGHQWGIAFSRSPRLGFLIVFSLTLLLLASVAAAYALVERYVAASALSRSTVAFAAGSLDAADRNAQAALSFAPTPITYQTEAIIANSRLNQIAASTTISAADAQKAFQAALSAGINAALTATRLDPNNYQNWIALGNLYADAVPLKVASAYDSAKAAYEKAQVLNPTSPQIPYTLAQLDIANGNSAAAQTQLQQAISLKQDYTAAIFLLSQLEVQSGNLKGALSAAEAAAYFTPNNPNILFQVGLLRAASDDLPGASQALLAAVTANPQFANARYFLAAVLAKEGNTQGALAQVQAIADLSSANAQAVAAQLSALKAGRDPFPANLLSASSSSITSK